MINEGFKKVAVKTWHLLFNGIVPVVSGTCTVERWNNPDNIEYLSLYKRVGKQWGWTGRLLLTPETLADKLNSGSNEVWLFKTEGKLLGFFEIDRSKKQEAEIVYFGLLPDMIGKGFGKLFIEAAIATASGENGDRVWLHTCEYDHPKALEIYLKAGFVIERESIEYEFYTTEFLRNRRT